jgi:hypothetical protein
MLVGHILFASRCFLAGIQAEGESPGPPESHSPGQQPQARLDSLLRSLTFQLKGQY